MPKYFQGLTWDQITREERVFCAELFFRIRDGPAGFVQLLKREAGVPENWTGPWEVAFEVCFYRDYCHRFNKNGKKKYSPKRTFDLAVFGKKSIIIIEAKAAQPFDARQASSFKKDRRDIKRLLGIEPHLVALACDTYFHNYDRRGNGKALAPFDGRITWESLAKEHPGSPLLERACEVYERRRVGPSKVSASA